MGMDNRLTEHLLEICSEYTLMDEQCAVLQEAYIPFIPKERWNRVLVLGESQNLSKTNEGYLNYLKSMDSRDRMMRLYRNENHSLGIGPWDDGDLKFAVEVGFRGNRPSTHWNETAVSNAVLWSQTNGSSRNMTPDVVLRERSQEIWHDFIGLLDPEIVVTAGRIAESMFYKHDSAYKHIALVHPAYVKRFAHTFDTDELLTKYPEIQTMLQQHKTWLKQDDRSGADKRRKVVYAVHAICRMQNLTN